MKKRILCLLMALLMLAGAGSVLSSCKKNKESDTYTRVTVEMNPHVELMLDGKGKVLAVTALNDDGSVLIAGEDVTGKSAEDAIALIVTLAADTGYLFRGEAELGDNTVSISVSGNAQIADKLWSSAEKKVQSVLRAKGISAQVKRAEALSTEALRELTVSAGLLTDEEAGEMNEEQLCRMLAAGRVETAALLTEDLRNVYFEAKEYRISCTEFEQILELMEGLKSEDRSGNIYNMLCGTYQEALESYRTAIEDLEQLQYKTLISPDSDYQKSLTALWNAKKDVLLQRSYTATLSINGQEYASAKAILQTKEETYDSMLKAYEQAGDAANVAFMGALGVLNGELKKLESLRNLVAEKEEFQKALRERSKQSEQELNEIRDGYFAEFEKKHSEDFQKVRETLIARKQQLIDQAKEMAEV